MTAAYIYHCQTFSITLYVVSVRKMRSVVACTIDKKNLLYENVKDD